MERQRGIACNSEIRCQIERARSLAPSCSPHYEKPGGLGDLLGRACPRGLQEAHKGHARGFAGGIHPRGQGPLAEVTHPAQDPLPAKMATVLSYTAQMYCPSTGQPSFGTAGCPASAGTPARSSRERTYQGHDNATHTLQAFLCTCLSLHSQRLRKCQWAASHSHQDLSGSPLQPCQQLSSMLGLR